MKIACLRCKRALAEYAATDRAIPTVGALARHLAECEECARELAWFRAADRDLKSSLTAEQVGAEFTDVTWKRFSTSARPRRSFAAVGMVLSAACAATIAVAILVRNSPAPSLFHAPGLTTSAPTKVAVNSDTGQFGVKKNPAKPTSRAGVAATQPEKNSSDHPAPIRHRRGRPTHKRRMMAHRTPIKAGAPLVSAAGNHSAGPQSVSWDQVASWYEYRGDYQSAAAAYLQAVRADPTDAHVFNAGRASECAGDVAQAIEYYARFLKHEREQESHSKQEEPPRKGTSTWNENRDSA